MKYVTACPNCSTQFLLNDALIEAYRGKVQCGNCHHVFNAKNRLTNIADDISSTDERQVSAEESTVADAGQALISDEMMTSDDGQNMVDEIQDNQSLSSASYIEEHDANLADLEQKSVDVDAIFTKKKRGNKPPSQYTVFMQFISFFLLIAGALQASYFLRNDIARKFPVMKPLLERACTLLKCTIDLPKNVDLISIGDSDMQEDDTYQSVIKFSSSIKNNAHYPQAYPNIELTLTDTDNLAVIRKLITPKSYLGAIDKIEHGLAPQQTATVKLALHVDDPAVASYRILLLY